jgi:hypothetical protein
MKWTDRMRRVRFAQVPAPGQHRRLKPGWRRFILTCLQWLARDQPDLAELHEARRFARCGVPAIHS